MMPKLEYKIITSSSVEKMEELMAEMLNLGWQKASPIILDRHAGDLTLIQELVRQVSPESMFSFEDLDKQFYDKYDKMDSRVKDLLDINGIRLQSVDGALITSHGNKTTQGIFPNEVLSLLKASKHCPLDLDETKVLMEVESLL